MKAWGEGADPDPRLKAAAQQLAEGNTEGALEQLTPLVASEAPSLAPRFLLGMLAWRMGRLDWSLDLVRQCHELDPMNGAVAEALASLLAQSGDVVECIYAAKVATALADKGPLAAFMPPDFPPFEVAFRTISERPKLAAAERAHAAGNAEEALENARQHVALAPNDPQGRGFYAELLLAAGRAGDAVDALRPAERDALQIAPLASVYARSLAACGELAAAERWHGEAERRAPDDAAIAAARILDGLWLDDAAALAERGASWARRFADARKPRSWRQPGDRIVIGYLVAALADPDDAAAVAAVARAHDRRTASVIAYAAGAQSWGRNAAYQGAFDRWRDVGAIDGATLARFIAQDGIDVLIDASGFAWPQGLQALARVGTALRVSWLGNPAGLHAPCFDARIASLGEADDGALWRIAGGYPIPPARPVPAESHGHVQFGADITLPQLDADTVAHWRAALDAVPEAKLLLRGRDMSPGAIGRLVRRMSAARAARVDIVTADRFEDFYARVDITLLTRRSVSARVATEAAACGVPVVAFAETGPLAPYGSVLHGYSGAQLVRDGAAYVQRARAARRRAGAAIAAAAPDAAGFARALEEHAQRALALGAAA